MACRPTAHTGSLYSRPADIHLHQTTVKGHAKLGTKQSYCHRGRKAALLACLLLSVSVAGTTVAVAAPVMPGASASTPLRGPYLNRIRYSVIEGESQRVSALINGGVDVVGTPIANRATRSALLQAERVMLLNASGGCVYLAPHMGQSPFNYTAFRKAVALALDKERTAREVFGGWAVPADSWVPIDSGFSSDGILADDYYDQDIEAANALLDRAGFSVDPVTGLRRDPQNRSFTVTLGYPSMLTLGNETAHMVADALEALDVAYAIDKFYEWWSPHSIWSKHNVLLLEDRFPADSVEWMASEFHEGSSHQRDYVVDPDWQNATYETLTQQLLGSSSYVGAVEAAIEMQRVLVEDCPVIVCCQLLRSWALRTDRLNGAHIDPGAGIINWWTALQLRLKGAGATAPAGEAEVCAESGITGFNFMTADDYSAAVILTMYDCLMRVGPDGTLIPWLATSYTLEGHADNPAVPAGHLRATFTLVDNATWSDGELLTAGDVTFSINYYTSGSQNPYGEGLDLYSVYSPHEGVVIVEFSSENYWDFRQVALLPVLPQHQMADSNPDDWHSWHPAPTNGTLVVSGPFHVGTYSESTGECTMVRTEDYFYRLPPATSTTTTTIATTTTVTTTVSTTTTTSIVTTTETTTVTTSESTSTTGTTGTSTTGGNSTLTPLGVVLEVVFWSSTAIIMVFSALVLHHYWHVRKGRLSVTRRLEDL